MNDKQRVWDEILVRNFYINPHKKMSALSYEYKELFECWANEEKPKLLRVAKEAWQGRMTVSRFVVALLPKLAKVLWNHKKEESHKIIAALRTSKLDVTNRSDEMVKTIKESTLFDKSAKDYSLSRAMYSIYKDSLAEGNQAVSAAGIKVRRAR